jgi:hypothetical protein
VAATYERVGAARDALQMEMLAQMFRMFAGRLETAYPELVAIVGRAERLDARYLADWTRWEVAIALLIKGDRARAEPELARLPGAMLEQPLFHDVTALFRAWASYASGDVDALARAHATSVGKLTYARFIAAFDAFGAFLRLKQVDFQGACDLARRAIVGLMSAAGLQSDGAYAGFAVALDVLVAARAPDAGEQVAAHVERLEQIAARMEDGGGEAFLRGVPWNRRVLDLLAALKRSEQEP